MRKCPTSLATILSAEQLRSYQEKQSFSDSEVAVIDNCAMIHVWNDRQGIVLNTSHPYNCKQGVVTIGGDDHHPSEIADVEVGWKDDDGVFHHYVLHNVLIFPTSPVKINSSYALAGEFVDENDIPDEEGTWIQ